MERSCPNLALDRSGHPYLALDSFFEGLKLIKLTADGMHTAQTPNDVPVLTSRSNTYTAQSLYTSAGTNSIEAPFIYYHEGYYYLFASVDYCCQGVKSTYKIIVGRSASINGDYLDKNGRPMNNGGGTYVVINGDNSWSGTGHNSAINTNGTDHLVYHAYDKKDNGTLKLRIQKINWDKQGWPTALSK